MPQKARGDTDMARVLDRERGRGGVAEQVRGERSAQAFKGGPRDPIINRTPRHWRAVSG